MKIIITGTTGYVGEGVMLSCLDNPEVEKVLSVSRRPCGHVPFKGAYNFRPAIMWRYKGQKRIQPMQYAFWAMYPFFKLIGMWNRMSEVADAMIAVSKNGYHKAAIECRDITELAKLQK